MPPINGPTRRGFLHGLSLAGAASLMPPLAWPQSGAGPMTRTIPASGEAIPAVGLGSWITFNVGEDPALLKRRTAVIEAFFDAGGAMIDSSPMYGSSQATIGHALTQLGRPAGLFSADKIWTSDGDGGAAQADASSEQWGLPRFDLLQVHNLRAWRDHLPVLREMKAAGELRYLGVTTSDGRRHDALEALMRDEDLDFIQVSYNILNRQVEERLLPLARDRGMGVIVNRPFQQDRLTRWLEGKPLPGWADDIGATTWAQALLKFLLAQPDITCVIPATTQPEHARENLAAASEPLPDNALRERMAADVRAL